MTKTSCLAAMVLSLVLPACGSDSGGGGGDGGGDGACPVDDSYDPVIDPADFSTTIDNPYLPWIVGTTFHYTEGENTVEVLVTSDTKEIMGVTTVQVHDTLYDPNGGVLEDTYDWYAQDKDGAVWYFGEDTKEYEDGKVSSTEGSWVGGEDGAKPGMLMPADPTVGDAFRQEYHPCDAEDEAEIIATHDSATVPFGSFDDCVHTHEFTRIEPDVNEEKLYCRGVGIVLEMDKVTGERTELFEVDTP